jgi:hypothetical protein
MPRGVRREDAGAEGSPIEGKLRQRFGRDEDLMLVAQVRVDAPYKAKHGAIGGTWDVVADKLNQHPDFHMRPIKGTTAKARFETLVGRHRLWMSSVDVADGADSEEGDIPYRLIMNELVREIDGRARARDEAQEDGEARTSTRLGKRRASSDNLEEEAERERRPVFVLPRAVKKQPQPQPVDVQQQSYEIYQVEPTLQEEAASMEPHEEEATQVTETSVEAAPTRSPAAPAQEPVTGDLVTAQQAMAELLKMQHAFAARPSEVRVIELEKMNEARLREEEEKTKQRGLELQIEIQRTKRRQLELDFEREERKKDREEQAKLIASLVQRLEPKGDATLE